MSSCFLDPPLEHQCWVHCYALRSILPPCELHIPSDKAVAKGQAPCMGGEIHKGCPSNYSELSVNNRRRPRYYSHQDRGTLIFKVLGLCLDRCRWPRHNPPNLLLVGLLDPTLPQRIYHESWAAQLTMMEDLPNTDPWPILMMLVDPQFPRVMWLMGHVSPVFPCTC